MTQHTMSVLTKASIGQLRGIAHGEPKTVWEMPLAELVATYSLSMVDVNVRYDKGNEFRIVPPRDRSRDRENAEILHIALPELTPSQATDERIWATLALGDFKEYVLRRWAVNDAADYPLDIKVFVANTRSLVREHAIARLWWRGHFARQVKRHHSLNPLELMFEHEDIPGQIAGRSIMTDSRVLSAYFGQLESGLKALSENTDPGSIDPKRYIQGLGKQLNFLAGRFQLGAVSEERLSALFQIAHRNVIGQNGQATA